MAWAHNQPCQIRNTNNTNNTILFKINIPGDYALFQPNDSAAFLAALASAQVVETEGWGDEVKHKKSKKKITIELVAPPELEEIPAPMVELQKSLRTAESRWLDQYNKANKAEARVKELEAKLAEIQSVTQPT